MDIKQELLDIVKDYVDVPAKEIDTALGFKYVGINSFVVLSMVSNIEEHFNISIPDSKLMEFTTLDDMIEFISGELAWILNQKKEVLTVKPGLLYYFCINYLLILNARNE